MRPITVTVGPLVGASANNIATSQTPTSTVTLNGTTVSGGVATLDTPRRVLITPAADESTNSFTIVGTGWGNNAQITEVLTGAAVAFYSNLDFKTVTSITLKKAAAGAITVGTNGVASSQWIHLDEWANGSTCLIQCTATGTVNYTVQETMQSPTSLFNVITAQNVTWANSADTAAVGATGSILSNFPYIPLYTRILLNSGTGSVSAIFMQTGAVSQ